MSDTIVGILECAFLDIVFSDTTPFAHRMEDTVLLTEEVEGVSNSATFPASITRIRSASMTVRSR